MNTHVTYYRALESSLTSKLGFLTVPKLFWREKEKRGKMYRTISLLYQLLVTGHSHPLSLPVVRPNQPDVLTPAVGAGLV